MIISEQYMVPTIISSVGPLRSLHVVGIVERLLKLAIPTLYGWLIIFYALFHVWLNILAEFTYFGDREFYKVRRVCISHRIEFIQENFDKRDNLLREKVSKRDNFPCYLT
jgi:hypothetical protein